VSAVASTNRRGFLSAGIALAAAAPVATATAVNFYGPGLRAQWDAAMARAENAKRAYLNDPDRADELCDAWSDAESDLMGIPAPDLQALRWKLDHFMLDHNGVYHASYSVDFLRQTIADYQRLMPVQGRA